MKTVTIPTMDDAEIKKALQFGSLWNNFMSSDQNPEDYSIFYQVIRRKKSEETMDVMLAATRLSDIQLYTDIVKKSGLNPVIVDLRCFAINHAFNQKINNQNKSETNVFLEFNFEESYAMITNGSEAHVFDIFITDSERAAIIDTHADENILDNFIKKYARQIKSTIDEYEYKHNTEIIKNIYVLSSLPLAGVIIEKLSKTLEYYTISHCNFFDCMQIDDDFTINSSSAINSLSSWSSAIGSALRHIDIFGKTKQELPYLGNLLPEAGKYEKTKRAEYIANAAIMTASVAITWFMSSTQIALHYKNQELSSQLATLAGAENLYNKQSSEESALNLAANNMSEVDDLINEVSANQGKLLSIQKYLNVAIVDNVWLKEFNFNAPDQISITGGATEDSSILAFIDMLNQGQQFDKVALRGMQEIHELSFSYPEASTVKNFQIDGTISSAEMTTPPPSEVLPEDPAPVIIVDEKDKRVN